MHTDAGIRNLYTINWLFGFVVSIFLYAVLSWLFPDRQTLLTETIWSLDGLEGQPIDARTDDEESRRASPSREESDKEKGALQSDAKVF